jgi:bacteriocin-like protein
MANIQIADLAEIENQFDELSDLELEAIIGGKGSTSSGSSSTTSSPYVFVPGQLLIRF